MAEKEKSDLLKKIGDAYAGLGKAITEGKTPDFGNLPIVDSVRKLELEAQHFRIQKETADPAAYHEKSAEFFGLVRMLLGTYVAAEEYKGRFDDFDPDKKYHTLRQLGSQLIADYVNPHA